MKFCLLKASYVLNPLSQASCNSSLSGCMYTFIFFPRIVGPWNYQRQENVLSLHNMSGGGLSGKTNTGQQLYWAAVIPNTLNPSVLMPTRGCLGFAALSACNSSNFFHATPSDVCTIIRFPSASSSVLLPVLCHVICLAVSSTMKRR